MKKLFWLLAMPLVLACGNTEKGSGKIIQQKRTVGIFTGVATRSSIAVEIKQGNQYVVEVSADDNLINLVMTEVKDNILTIHYKPNTNIKNGHVKVKVVAPKFEQLLVASSATITATNTIVSSDKLILEAKSRGSIVADVNCYTLHLEAVSSGDLLVSGQADNVEARASSSGSITGKSLTTAASKVTANSRGKIILNASNTMTANAHSSGIIRTGGTATVQKEEGSGGKVEAY
jgi:predicted small secreted protein